VADAPLKADDAERRARAVVYAALDEYAVGRIDRYRRMRLGELLQKDLLMMAMRGVGTGQALLETAFVAFESSSEETKMGGLVQRIATDLAERAVDLGDLVVETADGDLWIVEVKSQTNTITGGLRNAALRTMKERLEDQSKFRRVRRGKVRALLGVVRGASRSEEIVCQFPSRHRFADLNGFEYSYKVGKPFWEWLTGRPGLASMVDTVPPIAEQVAVARQAALDRLQIDLAESLEKRGFGTDVPAVLRLADEQYR
jgi:hypothetical protein